MNTPTARIVEQSSRKLQLELEISSDLSCLSGHFPGRGIVPGYVLIDWVLDFCRSHLQPITLFTVKRARFHKTVEPPLMLVLQLRLTDENLLNFSYKSQENTTCARGQIYLQQVRHG